MLKKKIAFILASLMLGMVFMSAAMACDDSLTSREDGTVQVEVLTENEILSVISYVQSQYNVSTNIAEKMGYLFALKAMAYRGTSYSSMDCSKLVATAIYDAYQEYGYGSYSPFIDQRTSRNQYSYCNTRGFTIEISDPDDLTENETKLKTGDLIFWQNANSTVNHVAIYISYASKAYLVESLGSENGVVVTEAWYNTEKGYTYKCAARLCRTYKATFKTGEPFNENLGQKTVFYNFPPELPTLPTHSGYTIGSWTPSITAGITANTTYTGNYVMRADSNSNID